jgi:hypothetical protein
MISKAALRASAAILLTVALAACGGGSGGSSGGSGGSGGGSGGGGTGGGGGGSGGGDGSAVAFSQRLAEFDALADEIFGLGSPERRPAGTASYEGNMALTMREGTRIRSELLGDLELVANFDTGRIRGEATNFVGYNGTVRDADPSRLDGRAYATTGSLDVTANMDGNTFTGRSSGRLTQPNGARGDFNLNVGGGFRGTDASHVAGIADGTVDLSSGGTSLGQQRVTGSFAGVRDD